MARYFFHYRDGDQEEQADDEGIEFATVEDAYLNAFEAALTMWSELLRARRDPRACSFTIVDEHGRVLFVLPFSEVLDSCRKRPMPVDLARGFQAVLINKRRTESSMAEFRGELNKARRALDEARALLASVG